MKMALPLKIQMLFDNAGYIVDATGKSIIHEQRICSPDILENFVEIVNTDKFILRLNKDLTHEDFDGIVGYKGEYFWPSVVSANRNFYYKLDLSVGGYFDDSFFDRVPL